MNSVLQYKPESASDIKLMAPTCMCKTAVRGPKALHLYWISLSNLLLIIIIIFKFVLISNCIMQVMLVFVPEGFGFN